jgi:membrane protease YdiL (CAAX protease family)
VATNSSKTPKTLRNLIIFVLIGVIGLPWLGWALDVGRGADPHDQQNSLGWLFFIVAPLAVLVLLRAFAGDGWQDLGLKPNFKGNGKWYLFALLFHPVTILLMLLIGALFGVTTFPDLSAAKWALLGQAILMAFIPNFIKNIFEEFAWRGHLTPKVQAVVKNPLIGHLIVGAVWFTWHLPYYLVLLPPASLSNATSLSLGVMLLMTFFSIFPLSVVYGELRLRTNSVWPAVLVHMTANAFFDSLVAQKFFSIQAGWPDLLFAPALFSVSGILLNLGAAIWLYRQRASQKGQENA